MIMFNISVQNQIYLINEKKWWGEGGSTEPSAASTRTGDELR